MSTGDLTVGKLFTIPERELIWRFDTSGGPGGQHANRSATRVELSYDLGNSEAPSPKLRERLISALATRLRDGVISVTVDETRSQWRNRSLARRRLAALLEEAARPEVKRRPTRPGRAARRRRLEDKRRRGRLKRMRGKPDDE